MLSDKIKNIIAKFWHWPILIIIAAGFFVGTASFNYYLQKDDFVKWISPDETANYTFAKLYAQTGSLEIFEKYNLYVEDIIHPRSFRSDNGYLKPVSFLGLALIYGKIASIIGYKILPYLTPFFGAIGIIFFYLLIKKIFGRRNALLSAFLLASFPVYTYYSARSMFHNVLFTVLLIIGLYFTVLMGSRKKESEKKIKVDWAELVYAALGGVFVGLAAITRSSELLWMAPIFFLLWVFNIRNVGLTRLLVFVSFFLFALTPALFWNQILYGAPANGGYPEMNRSLANIKEASSGLAKATLKPRLAQYKELFLKLKDNIFVFGFHPRDSWKTFNNYFIAMFPWIFWPALIGFLAFFSGWKKIKKKHLLFAASLAVVSLILVIYYGSWKFNDNPDPSQITIGNSYTRYWLPIYLGALPFVSVLVLRLTDFKKKEEFGIFGRLKRYSEIFVSISGRASFIVLIFFISIFFVLYGSNEGLVQAFRIERATKSQLDAVLALTEKNSTIITRYHDKLFFPERKVIIGLFDDKNMIALYARLVKKAPVYYYNFAFPDKDYEYLNSRKLADFSLGINEIKKTTDQFALYKLYIVTPSANSTSTKTSIPQ